MPKIYEKSGGAPVRFIRTFVFALISALLFTIVVSTPALANHLTPDAYTDTQPGEPPNAPPEAVPQSTPPDSIPDVRIESVTYSNFVYLPLTRNDINGLSVNPQNKDESSIFYRVHYSSSEAASQRGERDQGPSAEAATARSPIDLHWTGNHATCDAGDMSQEFRDAVLLRINYFRAMAGVPADVKFADEYNRKAQQAALMMSANDRLSHTPDSSWNCYTDEGAQAAGGSNLFLGVFGWNAISGYIEDPGDGNFFAGHRRWVLYPQTKFMGSGDIPATDNYRPANVLWVFDDHMWESRPPTREEFVAWPPPGYTPYQVASPLWSFAYADADFSDAVVTMTSAGNLVSLTQYEALNGFGENTMTWKPDITLGRPTSDVQFTVEISNVRIDGAARNFAYNVTIFDPDA